MTGGSMDAKLTGRWGEALIAEHYRKKGYRLIDTNHRYKGAEIDLVFMKKKLIVFTEVKVRKSSSFAPASASVTVKKKARLRYAANLWLASAYAASEEGRRGSVGDITGYDIRFDIAEVYAPDGYKTKTPEINILENAFGDVNALV